MRFILHCTKGSWPSYNEGQLGMIIFGTFHGQVVPTSQPLSYTADIPTIGKINLSISPSDWRITSIELVGSEIAMTQYAQQLLVRLEAVSGLKGELRGGDQ